MKIVFNYLFDIKKRRKFQDEKGLRVDRLNAYAIAWASTYQTLGTSYGHGIRRGSRFFLAKEIINGNYQIEVVPDTDLGFN